MRLNYDLLLPVRTNSFPDGVPPGKFGNFVAIVASYIYHEGHRELRGRLGRNILLNIAKVNFFEFTDGISVPKRITINARAESRENGLSAHCFEGN